MKNSMKAMASVAAKFINDKHDKLTLNFDKNNQAIGGTYNGQPIEEYYTYDTAGNTTPLPKHICELIDYLNKIK